MFRRAREPESAPPRWQERVDRARAVIDAQRPPSWVLDRVDELVRSLHAAEADHLRLATAAEQLDSERAADELKAALRALSGGAEAVDDELVRSLRRRYETVHDVLNRRDRLRATVDRAIVDLELLAARSVALAAGDWDLDGAVEQLRTDVDALHQAHREVADL